MVCEMAWLHKTVHLAHAHFAWIYTKGKGLLSPKKISPSVNKGVVFQSKLGQHHLII